MTKINKYIDEIICGDNVEVLREFPDECIDLTVTSPPYDNLRTYNGFDWDFEALAKELYRVTKEGGVVVWVVADKTVNKSETGTSFRQALYFKEVGFNLHDTMIFLKNNPVPQIKTKRYTQAFEYMFVLSKGTVETCNYLTEPTLHPGKKTSRGGDSAFRAQSADSKNRKVTTHKKTKIKTNVWAYNVGTPVANQFTKKHPATFPEQLANDHILSWSNEGDIVLDPFIGSGTTAKMAALNDRKYIGIDISDEYCELARKRVSEATE